MHTYYVVNLNPFRFFSSNVCIESLLVLFTFLESKTVPNIVHFAGLTLVQLGVQS